MDSKSGEKVPRLLGETVYGTRPGKVVHVDYLHVGASGPLGDDGLDEDGRYRYILVMMDDMSNWVWLRPTEACTARLTAQHLLTWCKIIGVPEVWVDVLDEKALRAKVQSVVAAKSQLHKEVLDKVQAHRGKQRVAASRGSLPIFFAGDYVLVARVRRSGSTPKLLMTWTGPWRVLIPQRSHVYGVQNIVPGEV